MVVRKYSEPLDEHANFLISVPGGNDGPSGVLICSENYITYKNLGDQPDIRSGLILGYFISDCKKHYFLSPNPAGSNVYNIFSTVIIYFVKYFLHPQMTSANKN